MERLQQPNSGGIEQAPLLEGQLPASQGRCLQDAFAERRQAYSVYASPPLREKLHPNMVIRLVHRTDHYANDEVRRLGMEDWDAWANAVGMIFWRPNSLLWGRHEGTTGVYVHKLAEDFRHIAQNKCVGTDFDSCMHHWASQGLNYYVLGRVGTIQAVGLGGTVAQ